MNTIKSHKLFKTICFILIAAFICLDISYAYPPDSNAQSSTLAIPSVLQQQPATPQAEALQKLLFANGSFLGTVCSVAKCLLEDNLKLDKLAYVLGKELGERAKSVDLNHVRAVVIRDGILRVLDQSAEIPEDAIILVPYNKEGQKGILEIALINNPGIDKLPGKNKIELNKYVIKDLPEGYEEPATSVIAKPAEEGEASPVSPLSLRGSEATEAISSLEPTRVQAITSINPFAVIFGAAAIGSIFEAAKEFAIAQSVIAGIIAIGVGVGSFFTIWRYLFPVSWHLYQIKHGKNYDTYHKNIEGLARIGAPAVPDLIDALASENDNVRQYAASILGDIKDPRAVEPLIRALSDHSSFVRSNAAQALGCIKDLRAVEPLIMTLSDKDYHVYVSVTSALGNIKDLRAVEPLIKNLSSDDKEVREWAARALGYIGDARAVEPVIKMLELFGNNEYSTRYVAIETLAKLYGKQGRSAIRPLAILLGENIHNTFFGTIRSVLKKIVDPELLKPLEEVVEKLNYKLMYNNRIAKFDDSQIKLLADYIVEGRIFNVSYIQAQIQEGYSGVDVFSGYAMTWPDKVITPAKITITPTSNLIEEQEKKYTSDPETLLSINPFAVIFGAAAIGSIFLEAKDIIAANPVVSIIAAIFGLLIARKIILNIIGKLSTGVIFNNVVARAAKFGFTDITTIDDMNYSLLEIIVRPRKTPEEKMRIALLVNKYIIRNPKFTHLFARHPGLFNEMMQVRLTQLSAMYDGEHLVIYDWIKSRGYDPLEDTVARNICASEGNRRIRPKVGNRGAAIDTWFHGIYSEVDYGVKRNDRKWIEERAKWYLDAIYLTLDEPEMSERLSEVEQEKIIQEVYAIEEEISHPSLAKAISSQLEQQSKDKKDSTTLNSINPFAIILGAAAIGSIFEAVKDLAVKYPWGAGIAGLGVAVGLYFLIWRVFFPISWHIWKFSWYGSWEDKKRDKVVGVLKSYGMPAAEALQRRLQTGDRDKREKAVTILGKLKFGPAAVQIADILKEKGWSAPTGAAETALINIGKPALASVVDLLENQDKNVRCKAVNILGQIKDESTAGSLAKMLADSASEVADKAVVSLASIGPAACDEVIKYLNNEKPVVKARAAKTLGMIKDVRSINNLVKTLSDNDADVRKNILWALGEIKDSGPTLTVARSLLNDKEPIVRAAASEALGKIKDLRSLESLSAALRDPDAKVRDNTVNSLVGFGNASTSIFITALAEKDADLRKRAAGALGRTKDASAIEPLVQMLRDKNSNVRKIANGSLFTLGWKPANTDEEILSAIANGNWHIAVKIGNPAGRFLVGAMADADKDVRRYAAESLGKIKYTEGVSALINALEDEDADVRNAAATALGAIKDVRAVEPLSRALRSKDNGLRYNSAKALAEIGSASIDALAAALKDDSGEVRQFAATSLGDIRDSRVIAPLSGALKDVSFDVRSKAAASLNKLGWKPSNAEENILYYIGLSSWSEVIKAGTNAVRYVKPFLSDESYGTRERAAYVLGEIKERDTSVLISLAALLEDEYNDVRRAAALALDKLGWQPLNANEAMAYSISKQEWQKVGTFGADAALLLARLLADKDSSCRISAARILLDILTAKGAGLQPLKEYLSYVKNNSSDHSGPITADQLKIIIDCITKKKPFEIKFTAATTREEESYDPYGPTSTYTVVDTPAHILEIKVEGVIVQPQIKEEINPVPAELAVERKVVERKEVITPQYAPDVSFWELKVVPFDASKNGLSLFDVRQIIHILDSRSWIWRQVQHDKKKSDMAEMKIRLAQRKIPAIIATLYENNIISAATPLVSIYLAGSFPWAEKPNDIDIIVVVEGEKEFERIQSSNLSIKSKEIIPDLETSFEVVGLETLKKAARGEEINKAKVIRRKLVVYSGAIPLAGVDIFYQAKIPVENYIVMKDDLITNARLANWEEIKTDPAKVGLKKAWRAQEASALEKWIELKKKEQEKEIAAQRKAVLENIAKSATQEIAQRKAMFHQDVFGLVKSMIPKEMEGLTKALVELKPLSEQANVNADAISAAIAQAKEKYSLSDEETKILWLALTGPGQGMGKQAFDEGLVRNQLHTILHNLRWAYKNTPLSLNEERTISAVEEQNALAGPGADDDHYDSEPGHVALSNAYRAVIAKMKLATDAKIKEIINWVKENPKINFIGEEVDILDGTGPEAKVIGRIDRAIAEKFGFVHETTNTADLWPVISKLAIMQKLGEKPNAPLGNELAHVKLVVEGMKALIAGDYDYILSYTQNGTSLSAAKIEEFKNTMTELRDQVEKVVGQNDEKKLILSLMPMVHDIGKVDGLENHWTRGAELIDTEIFQPVEKTGLMLPEEVKNTLTLLVKHHFSLGEIYMAANLPDRSEEDIKKTIGYIDSLLEDVDKEGQDFSFIMTLLMANTLGDMAQGFLPAEVFIRQFNEVVKYSDKNYFLSVRDNLEVKSKAFNPLPAIYEKINQGFQNIVNYPDSQGLARVERGYEPVANNTRRPGETDILATVFELPAGELSRTLEKLTDDIIKVLPQGTIYHKIDPATYHISVAPIQDLPFDAAENKLTDIERKAAEEVIAKIAANQLPYRVKFLGLRFGMDGGVIAVFEDEGLQTKSLRKRIITECNKVCNDKISLTREKPLVNITLMRIFSNIKRIDLDVLKIKAKELKDLSRLGLSMELRSLNFCHETRWMHSETDYRKEYDFGTRKSASGTIEAKRLFEIVKSLNNERAEFIETANRIGANVDKTMASAEIRQKVEALPRNDEDIKLLKKNLDKFEANGAVLSLIVLARRAKRENQKLLLGLETDWIPGLNEIGYGSQHDAINALMNEIDNIADALKEMGLDNVEIVKGSGDKLASALLEKAEKTHNNLHNIVVLALEKTINSSAFAPLKNADENDKPFLAGINPKEIMDGYEKLGEATSQQLYIKLAQMLYITLEVAAGKQVPKLSMVVFYDEKNRMIVYMPSADIINYEAVRDNYAGEAIALAAA